MKKTKRIINSLLDLDYYKLTMAQVAFFFFRYIPVVFGFKNRTARVKIAKFVKIKDLILEFEHVRALRVTKQEIAYLESLKIFKRKFLDFLNKFKLPEYKILENNGQFIIEFSGNWAEVTFWETICLSIVNELYYKELLKKMSAKAKRDLFNEGKKRLEEKIKILKANPEIIFTEFGTRRRFSFLWQYYVVKKLAKELPGQFMGTSNVYLAMKLNLKPIGTFAHEMYMILSGIFRNEADGIKKSHNKVLEYWWGMYGKPLSIALTDTYGTDFFFKDMTREQAKKWQGLRHDSGDPIEFGEKAIQFYEKHGIDPLAKILIFSDGLNINTILKIEKHFRGRIKVAFGWGTNLTNDLGLKALSMVVKAIKANGYGTVKLSDNLAKAMGSKEDIALFKQIFKHITSLYEECVY
ncbi:nicotinate phosphoribosyltransferase [Candidatus Parcubacteria bacterium]|nr:nicotinate phosphoribosyltransferase [Candidatus Parcubacteria bacterium]